MNSSVSPFLSLCAVIRGLRGSLGGWGVRGWLHSAVVLLVYRRLGEICGRMERMAARFQAGRLWRVEGRRGSVRAGAARRVGAGPRIWPGAFGWLVKAASWHAAGFGSQLRAVLETPEMVDLLAAAPEARRVLRPLCRMLAVENAVLQPRAARDVVVAPEGAVAAEERPKRVRRPRATVDLGRVPIPRGVMAAVRRGRYGVV